MSLDILKNDIKQNCLRKLYYIHGEELFLKQFYLGEVKKTIFAEDSDKIDLIEFDGVNLSAEEIAQSIESFPIMSGIKLIVIRDVTFGCEGIVYLISHPEILNSDTVVVFYDTVDRIKADGTPVISTDASKKFDAFIKKFGLDVFIAHLDRATLVAWLSKQSRMRSSHISEDTARYLISCVGNDMFQLLSEIGKLCSYCGEEITSDAIDDICIKTDEAKMYELTDAVTIKDAARAYKVLDILFEMKTDSVAISAVLTNYIANLYKLHLMLESGLTAAEMSAQTGMRDFVVRRILPHVKSLTEDELGLMIDCCTNADIALKSTSIDSATVLSRLIAELIALC